jgi:hypothetical protein
MAAVAGASPKGWQVSAPGLVVGSGGLVGVRAVVLVGLVVVLMVGGVVLGEGGFGGGGWC